MKMPEGDSLIPYLVEGSFLKGFSLDMDYETLGMPESIGSMIVIKK